MKTIVLGPPGTGKTTTLLDLVEEFLRAGTDIKKIGYFSFTRKASYEAESRAEEKFQIDKSEIPYLSPEYRTDLFNNIEFEGY